MASQLPHYRNCIAHGREHDAAMVTPDGIILACCCDRPHLVPVLTPPPPAWLLSDEPEPEEQPPYHDIAPLW